MTDLFTAIEEGDESTVRILAPKYRRDPADDGIVSFAYLENAKMLPVLVQCGIDINERDTTRATILMGTAAHGDIEILRWLINNGSDLNATNEIGETAFSYACAWDQLEAAQLLFEHGANPNSIMGDTTPRDDTQLSSRIRSFLNSIGAKRRTELC